MNVWEIIATIILAPLYLTAAVALGSLLGGMIERVGSKLMRRNLSGGEVRIVVTVAVVFGAFALMIAVLGNNGPGFEPWSRP